MSESPLFEEIAEHEEEKAKEEASIVAVLRHHWRAVLLATFCTLSAFALQGLLATYALALGVEAGGHGRSTVLVATTATPVEEQQPTCPATLVIARAGLECSCSPSCRLSLVHGAGAGSAVAPSERGGRESMCHDADQDGRREHRHRLVHLGAECFQGQQCEDQ